MELYENILKHCKDRDNTSFYNQDMGVLLQFCAWTILKNREGNEKSYSRNEFYVSTMNCESSALDGILSEDNEGDKKAQIEFLYADDLYDDLINNFGSINISQSESKFADDLVSKVLEDIFHLKVSEDLPVVAISSKTLKDNMQMYYFNHLGILLVVGESVDLNEKIKKSEEIISLFRVLSDVTRYKMVLELSKRDLTLSELSGLTGVSLSTTNHHIRQLGEVNIVSLDVTSKKGKGAIYTLNKEMTKNIMTQFIHDVL